MIKNAIVLSETIKDTLGLYFELFMSLLLVKWVKNVLIQTTLTKKDLLILINFFIFLIFNLAFKIKILNSFYPGSFIIYPTHPSI